MTGIYVGVIEWGSEYDDLPPAVIVGVSETHVRREAYDLTARFSEHEGSESIPAPCDLAPVDDPADDDAVTAYLDAWHDMTTAAWLTIENVPVLGAEHLAAEYTEWRDDRADLSAAEPDVRADDWHISDDTGCDLASRFAVALGIDA